MKENEELRSGEEEGMLALGASWRGGPEGSHSSTRRFPFTLWDRHDEETLTVTRKAVLICSQTSYFVSISF